MNMYDYKSVHGGTFSFSTIISNHNECTLCGDALIWFSVFCISCYNIKNNIDGLGYLQVGKKNGL